MYGIGAKLPLAVDDVDGHFSLVKTIAGEIKQNMVHIIMTSPGERIMDNEFGVGVRRFLFEPLVPQIRENLRTRIYSQVKKYLPFVVLGDVSFDVSRHENLLGIGISYYMPNLGEYDTLMLDFANSN